MGTCDPTCENKLIESIDGDKCGYKCARCVPKDTCYYEGKQYNQGETWKSKRDMCTTCYCPEVPDENGLYKAQCNTQCCGDCAAGHVRVPQKDSCCGKCIPLSCTSDGETYSIGDTWSPMADKCIKCECKSGMKEMYAECFNTRTAKLQDCPEEYIVKSEDGCSETCDMPVENTCEATVDYTDKLRVTLDGHECASEQDFVVKKCGGQCSSESYMQEGQVTKGCTCCSATKYDT